MSNKQTKTHTRLWPGGQLFPQKGLNAHEGTSSMDEYRKAPLTLSSPGEGPKPVTSLMKTLVASLNSLSS